MNTLRQQRVLGIGVAALLVVQALVAISAGAADPKTQAIPVTLWNVPGVASVDAIGSLVASVNVPTPAAGQSTENKWAAGMVFRFVGDTAPFGVISLDTDGTQKFASLALNSGSAVVDTERFPFDWQAGRYYFPLVVILPGSAVAGFVYDFDAAAWTFVGSVRAQSAWGELSPASATLLLWYGSQLDDCALYSRADHFRYAPYGIKAGNTITSTAGGDGVVPGDCPATVTPGPDPNFRRYQGGSATGPVASTTTTSASSTTTTTEGSTTTTSSTTTTVISTTLPSITLPSTTLPLVTTTTEATTTTSTP
jgi:hypothetical protein